MKPMLAIARNTFREAVRNKVFYIVLAFALLLLGASMLLAQLALDQHIRLIQHFGLAAINAFGLLLALFIGVNLIYEELERRTIYVLVAHGIPRHAFIIGKFLGLALTLLGVTLLMSLLFYAILWWAGGIGQVSWVLGYAIVLIFLRMLIVIAIALLFSSFSTPVLAAMLTLLIYIIGCNTGTLNEVIRYKHRTGDVVGEYLARFIYTVMPDLGRFNIMTLVSYGHAVSFDPLLIVVGMTWTLVFLGLAIVGFSVRDFK